MYKIVLSSYNLHDNNTDLLKSNLKSHNVFACTISIIGTSSLMLQKIITTKSQIIIKKDKGIICSDNTFSIYNSYI